MLDIKTDDSAVPLLPF